MDSGAYVRYFGVDADRRESASFLEAYGGAVGRDDQFYSLAFGRYNDWKLKAFYSETPSVFTSTYRSLWNGVGGDTLTLNGLTPGGASTATQTQTNIRSALGTTPASELGLVRKKGGLRYDLALGDEWKLYGAYTNERREGSRPYGMIFGSGDGGGNIESPESIDNTTHEFFAGLRYNDPVQSFNLELSASLYRNDRSTMTVQNPLTITTNTIAGVPASTFTFARFDSDPGNDYYKAKAEYARALPELWNGRLTASVALARSSQDDALIAPTLLPLTGGAINGVSAANAWNTTAALLRQNANAQIDTTLANVTLTVNPAPRAVGQGLLPLLLDRQLDRIHRVQSADLAMGPPHQRTAAAARSSTPRPTSRRNATSPPSRRSTSSRAPATSISGACRSSTTRATTACRPITGCRRDRMRRCSSSART